MVNGFSSHGNSSVTRVGLPSGGQKLRQEKENRGAGTKPLIDVFARGYPYIYRCFASGQALCISMHRSSLLALGEPSWSLVIAGVIPNLN